jgi:hypothetical protein
MARDEHRILAQMDELLEHYYRSRRGIRRGESSLRREVFSDFLDMAAHLLEKYHHPSAATSAAVLVGATLTCGSWPTPTASRRRSQVANLSRPSR